MLIAGQKAGRDPVPGGNLSRDGDERPCILVVEDDEQQQALMRSALERRGYRTEAAGDGLTAVRKLRSGDYSLALIDYNLPEVDGVATARLLRDMVPEPERPRLIAVTASVETVQARSGGQLFDAVVPKPLSLAILLGVVDEHIRSLALQHAARALPVIEIEPPPRRLRRLLLMSLPAFAGALGLAAGLVLVGECLNQAGLAAGALAQADAMRADVSAIVDTVEDATAEQRLYLLDGGAEARLRFETALQQVDRMMTSRALPASAPETAGTAAAAVNGWTEALVREAGRRGEAVSPDQARAAVAGLRAWGQVINRGSQAIAAGSLETLRQALSRTGLTLALALAVLFPAWLLSLRCLRPAQILARGGREP
jgi:CheY-like chemotaxis protein